MEPQKFKVLVVMDLGLHVLPKPVKNSKLRGSFDRKANSEDPDLTVLHCLKMVV